MSSPDTERQLLHYRIINKVGEGGMGQVFRAEDTRLGRRSLRGKRMPAPRARKLLPVTFMVGWRQRQTLRRS